MVGGSVEPVEPVKPNVDMLTRQQQHLYGIEVAELVKSLERWVVEGAAGHGMHVQQVRVRGHAVRQDQVLEGDRDSATAADPAVACMHASERVS